MTDKLLLTTMKRKDLHYLYCKTVGFMVNSEYNVPDDVSEPCNLMVDYIIDCFKCLNDIQKAWIVNYVTSKKVK